MDISNPLSSAADLVKTLVQRFVPVPLDKNQVAQMENAIDLAAQKGEIDLNLGQQKINEIEAASTNWFVAGARPAAMWVCVVGLAYQFLIYPLANSFYPHMTQLEVSQLMELLGGMLGLGGLRTFEKVKGVART